jgi:DNA repair protein RecO (recombination protein O)
MRPVLIPGNVVFAQFRARTEVQLPQATVELSHSRAALLAEPLAAAAVEWVTALVASALPERQPYPQVYEGLAGLLDAIEAAPSASSWVSALARFELLLLAELGYGRDASGLPALIGTGRSGDWPKLLEALEASGDDLFNELLSGRPRSLHDCRGRLVERLRRVAA